MRPVRIPTNLSENSSQFRLVNWRFFQSCEKENKSLIRHQIFPVFAQYSLLHLHMSLEQGTKLRNGKIIDSPSQTNTIAHSTMNDINTTNFYSNDNSDISTQLTEIWENYEKKINDLQAQFSQLKDLLMAIVNKPNEDEQFPRSQSSLVVGTTVADCHMTKRSATVIVGHITSLLQVSCSFVDV